ncbi:PREDICTED: uncharacterized protein LOC107092043 [Cyprinodon variegatus]|uniref:uncharacterized protein LOC107092043 n=1 Tax=Cyprinodon variegatus TaxID=28743 RepID=UPI00074272B8|nr:PREDICTED: uncharacterized protein LOC107092043 [Cyprinodon variegatus]
MCKFLKEFGTMKEKQETMETSINEKQEALETRLKETEKLVLELKKKGKALSEFIDNVFLNRCSSAFFRIYLEAQKVVFSAAAGGSVAIGPFTTDSTIIYRTVITNMGNVYNQHTGELTYICNDILVRHICDTDWQRGAAMWTVPQSFRKIRGSTEHIVTIQPLYSITSAHLLELAFGCIFAASVAGTYYSTFFYHAGGSQVLSLALMKNNEGIVTAYDHKTYHDGVDNGGNAAFLQLQQGDHVYMRLGANTHVWSDSHITTFSGILLHSP